MGRNGSGCPDPTYEQALPAIRREENIRAREKTVRSKAWRYCVHKSGGKRRWKTDCKGKPPDAGCKSV